MCGKKGQTDHRKLYHGTSAAFVKARERNGFKVSKDGMFGPGVHTTSDIEKAAISAAQHETKRGFGVVFVLGLGRCKTHYALGCSKSHQPCCQCRRWLQENCESQEVNAGVGIKRTEIVVRNPMQIAILGVIMESLSKRLQRERQCSKGLLEALSLAGRMRTVQDWRSEKHRKAGMCPESAGRSRLRDHWRRGGASPVTAIDSGVSSRLHRGIQKQGNARQSLSMCRFNFLDRLSPPTLVSAMLEAKDRTVHRLHHRNDGSR